MIRNQWYAVLESKEVKAGRPVGVTRMGEKLVFWRTVDGQVVCMSDICPHLGAPLHKGKVRGEHLACPFHGFEFDPSGQCRRVPALGTAAVIPHALRSRVYPTYETHDLIFIFWGEAEQTPAPPRFFESIGEDFSYISFRQHWPVHYSRMAENQLDVAHLPFVHASTIGRGGRVVVDGPLVRPDGEDGFSLWVYNRLDDGRPARRAEDLPEPQRHPFLQFRFGNLWHNWISDDVRVFIAFVPVDEENTLMYGRYYQRMVRLPLLQELFNLVGKLGSIVIANQDRRIVSDQLPKKSVLKKSGEKILPSDGAILYYRQRRYELKQAAGQEE